MQGYVLLLVRHTKGNLIAIQYTVSMFLVDVSRSMGRTRSIDLPDGPNGEKRTREVTNLEWAIQFVLYKIEEMVCISPSMNSDKYQFQ